MNKTKPINICLAYSIRSKHKALSLEAEKLRKFVLKHRLLNEQAWFWNIINYMS